MATVPHVPDAASSPDDPAAPAAAWVVRRVRGLEPGEARAFAAWRAADPRHEAELARRDHAWHGLDGLGAVSDLSALADGVLVRAQARRARRRRTMWGLCSAAAAAAVVLWAVVRPDDAERSSETVPTSHIQVLASTAHRMLLPDGSLAELNGDSVIETDFTPAERRVRLVRGEAHFVVMKNPSRPFLVTVGRVTVRAVGTAFNVRLGADSVEVLVTEGKVRLDGLAPVAGPVDREPAGPALTIGQRAQIGAASADARPAVAIGELKPTEVDEVLGWQNLRLVFNRTPLDEVVAAFNRHNVRQFVLADPALRDRTLTGTFRADNASAFARLLAASVDVRAEPRAGDVIALLPAR
ncbi:MAG: FecR domain-containing protein [Verrucomicrobia bacterium]|nr:FecR domain-containing protein [Verrucomicrobiota bacterium]